MTTVRTLASRAADATILGLLDVVQRLEIARCAVLSEGEAEADTSAVDGIINSSVIEIRKILVDFPEFTIWNHAQILATFNKDVISELDLTPKAGFRVKMEEQDLRRLIAIGTPDLLKFMIDRGLGVGTQLPVLFATLDQYGDEPRVAELADIIATELAPFEASRISVTIRAPALVDHSVYGITSPHFIPYLQAQAQAFPDDIQDALEKIFQDLDAGVLLRFHLAGFSLERPPAMATMEYAGLTRLVEKMQSAHGQLEIRKYTGDLDTFLETGLTTKVAAWIKSLGKDLED
jgi:hypothetical protein